MSESRYKDLALYRRLWQESKGYVWYILGVLVVGMVATPLSLLTPIPLKIVVDSALGNKPLPGVVGWMVPSALNGHVGGLVVFAAGLLVVVSALSQAQGFASTWLSTYTGEKLVLGFRTRLFAHAQRLSFAFHDARGTHDPTYRIQYDTSALRYVTIDGLIPLVTSGTTLVAMFYVIYRIDAELALVALAITPVLAGLVQFNRRRLRQGYKHVKVLESSALGVIQEVLTSLRVVKAFGQEPREEARYRELANEGVSARLSVQLVEGGLGFLLSVVTAAGTAAVLIIGVGAVQAGRITLGELLVVLGYLSQLYGPLNTVSRKVASFQGYLASAERAFALLDEQPDVVDHPDSRVLTRASGAIEFEHVSFSYGSDRAALVDASFKVDPGARVGVAGRTGAGKSTLMSLLTRFYDPNAGRILLDGVDVREYRVKDLRAQFAIVLQEPVLFSTTIRENILYARPKASMDDVERSAKAAGIHDFISQLPDGYDTEVGERGYSLSGGERQRVALARAFLRDAPILILDEPTSSVDIKTEAAIMEAMERLMEGRTTFIVAHRLTTLEDCDVLLLVDDGRLRQVPPDRSAVVQGEARLAGLAENAYGH